jgi:hypothetical protein
VLLLASCRSTQPQRTFVPADEAFAERARAAWSEALERAASLPASRILYDARFGSGAVKTPGNLAVVVGPGTLTAKATGPLGGEVGSYENGAFHGKQGEGLRLDPMVLRGVLAGVFAEGTPVVAGADAGDGLLRWRAAGGVSAEAILDVVGARLRSLHVTGPKGEIEVTFSGDFAPWPEVVQLTDLRSGRTLKLRRVASEPVSPEPDLAKPKTEL